MNYVYGLHAVLAYIQSNSHQIRQVLIQQGREDAKIQQVIHKANQAKIRVQRVSKHQIDSLTQQAVHQGVLAEIQERRLWTEADLPNLLSSLSHPPLLLILDGIQDPHNLGACLRTAHAAGVDIVLAPKDHAVSITPTVSKVASGAAEITPFIAVTNLARCLDQLKAEGIWIYGASEKSELPIYQVDLRAPLALVLGAEGTGLRRLTQMGCDGLVCIPMQGMIGSLNVSVAAGVCLFEAVRQRQFCPIA